MKIYTITTLFRSETDVTTDTFVAETFEDAVNIAKEERNEFKKEYFDDDDYYEGNTNRYYYANSNCCFLEFSAEIVEHEI